MILIIVIINNVISNSKRTEWKRAINERGKCLYYEIMCLQIQDKWEGRVNGIMEFYINKTMKDGENNVWRSWEMMWNKILSVEKFIKNFNVDSAKNFMNVKMEEKISWIKFMNETKKNKKNFFRSFILEVSI